MASRSAKASQRGIERILSQLERSIETGNFYEAHQLYRTLYFRYMAQHKYEECAELLYNGSIKLVANSQECSAADLGLLTIDVLEKCDDKKVDLEDWWNRLSFLIECLGPNVVERETIINRAIKYSGEVSSKMFGVPILHRRIGKLYWSEKNIAQARHHLMLCGNGVLFGKFLLKLSQRCLDKEVDLFIAQGILQLLSLKDTVTAERTFQTYVKLHPRIKHRHVPFDEPLLNFLYYLLETIKWNIPDTLPDLCRAYKRSLDRDEDFQKYLSKISLLYFDRPLVITHGTGNGNTNTNTNTSNNSGHQGNNSGGGSNFMGGMFGDLFVRLIQGLGGDGGVVPPSQGGGDGLNEAHNNNNNNNVAQNQPFNNTLEFRDVLEASNTFNELD